MSEASLHRPGHECRAPVGRRRRKNGHSPTRARYARIGEVDTPRALTPLTRCLGALPLAATLRQPSQSDVKSRNAQRRASIAISCIFLRLEAAPRRCTAGRMWGTMVRPSMDAQAVPCSNAVASAPIARKQSDEARRHQHCRVRVGSSVFCAQTEERVV